jgi:RNA polymerase sigma-70 factor, ECF subfamily
MEFRAFYDAHSAFVWRSLRRLGVSEPNLKDAMQDVFVVVHRRLADFEARAKVTTWLFRICLRTAKDYRRRAHVRREVFDETALALWADSNADGAACLERTEALALFEAALAKVDLEQRTVFILFELENMTGEEIAETLELPLGTVYSRLRLARAAFKRAVVQQAAVRRAGRERLEGAS